MTRGSLAKAADRPRQIFLSENPIYLPSPTHAEQSPLFDSRDLLVQGFENTGDFLHRGGWLGGTAEESVQLLFLLWGVGGKYPDRGGFAVEPVGHEDLNWMV